MAGARWAARRRAEQRGQPVAQARRRRRSTAVHDSSTRCRAAGAPVGRPSATDGRATVVRSAGRGRRARRSPATGSRWCRWARPRPCRRWRARRAARPPPVAASTVAARVSIGSSPVGQPGGARVVGPRRARSSRQRPCGQIALATPTGASVSTSARPCSTCSSTKAPTRRSASSSRPSAAGSCPAAAIASASVMPSASVSARARSGSSAPVSSREPSAGDAEPGALLVGEARRCPAAGRGDAAVAQLVDGGEAPTRRRAGRRRRRRRGTESRWLPRRARRPSASGSPVQAHRLPLPVGHDVHAARRSPAPRNHSRSTASGARSRRSGGSRRCRRPGRSARGRPTSASNGSRRARREWPCVSPPSSGRGRPARSATSRGQVVAGVDVPDDAHRRVVGEHPLELLRGQRRCRRRRMTWPAWMRPADADAAAVVDGHPGGAGRRC